MMYIKHFSYIVFNNQQLIASYKNIISYYNYTIITLKKLKKYI